MRSRNETICAGKGKGKAPKLLALMLAAAMAAAMLPTLLAPGILPQAYAGTAVYTDLIPTSVDDPSALSAKKVKFNDHDWYIINDESSASNNGSVTLLAADTSFGVSPFSSILSNDYSTSTVKAFLDGLTGDGGSFKDVAYAIEDTGIGKLFLLSADEITDLQLSSTVLTLDFSDGDFFMGEYWLRSPGDYSDFAAIVVGEYGEILEEGYPVDVKLGVRPAIKLKLESVVFNSETKAFSLKPAGKRVTIYPGSNMTRAVNSGAEYQRDVSGAMTDVVYTADDDYYFPEDYSVAPVNGISVTRNSSMQITVSGTPTADALIILPDPAADPTLLQSAITTASKVDPEKVESGYEKLRSAVEAGEKVLAEANPTLTQISNAVRAIKEALANLVFKPLPAPRGWYRGTDGRWRYEAQLLGGIADVKADWVKWNGRWYWLKADGAMARGQWIKDAGKWYYLGGDGVMLRHRGLFWGGSWYWLKADGSMAQDEVINIGFGEYQYNHWGQWTAYEAAKLS